MTTMIANTRHFLTDDIALSANLAVYVEHSLAFSLVVSSLRYLPGLLTSSPLGYSALSSFFSYCIMLFEDSLAAESDVWHASGRDVLSPLDDRSQNGGYPPVGASEGGLSST